MSQTFISFDAFKAVLLAAGYNNVVERTWEPNSSADMHTHPFDANVLMVKGEFTLTVQGEAPRKILPGDTFFLAANTPHAEQYSSLGATYWAARKDLAAH